MQEQGALPSPFERDFNDLRQPRGGQVRNEAGCYTNQIDDLRRLERFIVVGAEQGYCATEGSLTRAKLQSLDRLIQGGKGPEAVELIERISRQRRNLRQKPLLFAFARCARTEDTPTSKSAYRCFLNICRTPTHLFLFVKFCEEFSDPGSGWGRAHKRAIQRWYLQFKNNPIRLFRLVTKYKKREGWTHKDVLRLAHPIPPTNALAFVFSYITEQPYKPVTTTTTDDGQIDWMKRYDEARNMEGEEDMRFLIQEFGFSWEHIPTRMLNSSRIWQALLKDMPVEAFLRNLGRMTRLGMFQENSEEEEIATAKIGNMNIPAASGIESIASADNNNNDDDDEEEDGFTRRSNIIHPFRIFVALQNYQAGRGSGRGRLTWIPSRVIIRAQENAFYRAFKYLEPIDKKCLVAVDVSSSMGHPVLRTSNITCKMAAAAMAMSFTRTQTIHPSTIVGGFCTEFTEVQMTSLTTLEGAMSTMNGCRPDEGPSNCSAPIKWAAENGINDIDAFIILTANINSCGAMHPAEAVRQYRQYYAGNNRVKLVVVGLLDNDFSIADQLDWNMLDVAGFDLALPHVVAEFIGNND